MNMINHLIKKSVVDDKNKLTRIIEKIRSIDNRTIYEFSVRIKDKTIIPAFRLVNFDNHSQRDVELYNQRIQIISNIMGGNEIGPILDKLTLYKLPVYIGIEAYKSKFKYKLYINFYSIKNIPLLNNVAKDIYKKIIISHPQRYFSLLGLDIEDGKIISHKVYYLYDKENETNFIKDSGLPEQALLLFSKLNKINRNPYYVISERNQNGKCVSKKVEISPEVSIPELSKYIQPIISSYDAYLNVVILEKECLTLYFRFN